MRPSGPFFTADIRTSFFSADVLKKCALIALHLIAEDGRGRESGCQAPDLGDSWECGCPESPVCESEGEAWSEGEDVSSGGSHEGTVCNEALHVIGLCGPGDFLKEWELARVASSCHMALGHAVPGEA